MPHVVAKQLIKKSHFWSKFFGKFPLQLLFWGVEGKLTAEIYYKKDRSQKQQEKDVSPKGVHRGWVWENFIWGHSGALCFWQGSTKQRVECSSLGKPKWVLGSKVFMGGCSQLWSFNLHSVWKHCFVHTSQEKKGTSQ